MTTTGRYRFNRHYEQVYPAPTVWRISNFLDNAIRSINLFCIPPITNTGRGTNAELTFDISSLDPINNPVRREYTATDLASVRSIENVVGTIPVVTQTTAQDVYVSFTIEDLPSVDEVITVTEAVVPYNGDSTTNISAVLPLESVTTDLVAFVTFDMLTLPDV